MAGWVGGCALLQACTGQAASLKILCTAPIAWPCLHAYNQQPHRGCCPVPALSAAVAPAPAALLQECWTIRQGTPLEAHLMPYLVEDRQTAAGSLGYLDFMLQLQKQLMAK